MTRFLTFLFLAIMLALPATAQLARVNTDWAVDRDTVTITTRSKIGYTQMVDLEGLDSCSYSAQVVGSSVVSIIPQPDTNTPASAYVADGVALTSASAQAGTFDRLGRGYVSFLWAVHDPSANVRLTCTRGGDSIDYDGSQTVTEKIDDLDATKLDSADATAVLLQGENGIADVSDPNDSTASPDVVCNVATAGKCLFFSDTGEGFLNTSLTDWHAMNPIRYHTIVEPTTTQDQAAMDGTHCFRNPERVLNDRSTPCAVEASGGMTATGFYAAGPSTLGRVCVTTVATTMPDTNTNGCGTCASLDGGLTCINGQQASSPPADGTNHDIGIKGCTTYNYQLTTGDYFELYALTGDFSGATGEGVCTAGQSHILIEAEVYPR